MQQLSFEFVRAAFMPLFIFFLRIDSQRETDIERAWREETSRGEARGPEPTLTLRRCIMESQCYFGSGRPDRNKPCRQKRPLANLGFFFIGWNLNISGDFYVWATQYRTSVFCTFVVLAKDDIELIKLENSGGRATKATKSVILIQAISDICTLKASSTHYHNPFFVCSFGYQFLFGGRGVLRWWRNSWVLGGATFPCSLS